MSDLISRKALIEKLKRSRMCHAQTTREVNLLARCENIVKEQPPAQQWIPCSERLPQSEDKYGLIKCNVTVMRSHYPTSTYDYCDSPYEEYFVAGAIYDASQKIWHIGEHTQLNALIDIEDSPLNGDCVIAWMPLPEPYKGE